jgi:hypothetical protein
LAAMRTDRLVQVVMLTHNDGWLMQAVLLPPYSWLTANVWCHTVWQAYGGPKT